MSSGIGQSAACVGCCSVRLVAKVSPGKWMFSLQIYPGGGISL